MKAADTLTTNFLKTIRPTLKQSQLFNLVTFTIFPPKFKLTRLRFIYCILTIVIFLILNFVSIYELIRFNQFLLIYKTTALIQLIIGAIYIITAWICSLRNWKKFVKILNELIDCDRKFQQQLNIYLNYSQFRKRIIFEMCTRIFLILSEIVGQILIYFKISNQFTIILPFTYIFPFLINTTLCYQVIIIVQMIQKRFIELNRILLKNFVEKSKKRNYYQPKITVITTNIGSTTNHNESVELNQLCKVATLHHQLTKIIKLVNETFGLILVAMFALCFVNAVLGLYYIVATLETVKITWELICMTLTTGSIFLLYGFEAFYLCYVCDCTITEIKQSAKLLHKIVTTNPDIINEIEMFSLQIANEAIEFNAAGFFPINLTLVYSIIGGVTTYIIILIQLSSNKYVTT